MGRCEVEAGIGVTLDVGVAVEFGAVVGGDSADGAGLALDQLRGPAAELLGGACIEPISRYPVLRSTRVTTQGLPSPSMVSASQWPTRDRLSAAAGRCAMGLLPASRPRES